VPDELTDETWRRLNPYAGRLSTREARRLLLVVVTLVLLVLAGYAVNLSGVVSPRLITFPPATAWAEPGGDTVRDDPSAWRIHHRSMVLSNSWYEVQVRDARSATAGLELVEVSGLVGESLGYRQQRQAHLVFRVTDCDALPAGQWHVELTVARAWGLQSVTVDVDRYGGKSNDRLRDLVCERG
jgi:hypothetical protein